MPKGYIKAKEIPNFSDEPNMSDTTLLVTVEDLINRAMGPPDANIIDFKLVQMILEILARQQRLLLQKIEIRLTGYSDTTLSTSILQSPPQAKPFGTVKHKRKILGTHRSKTTHAKTERSIAEASAVNKNIIQIKNQADKDEKSKQILLKKADEKTQRQKEEQKEKTEQEKTEKLEQKEKQAIQEKKTQSEFREMIQIEQEETDKFEMVKRITQKKQRRSTSEIKSRKESLKNESGVRVEREEDVQISHTEQEFSADNLIIDRKSKEEQVVKNEEITKISHEQIMGAQIEEVEKESQKESTKLNAKEITKKRERKMSKEIPKKEREQVKSKDQIKTEKKLEKTYNAKDHIPASVAQKNCLKKISETSRIEITEKLIDSEKILVVEKGPSTRSETLCSSAIDFVTTSQFAFLEAAVEELKSMAPPRPIRVPENEKLMNDMIKGTVTLPEAMEILQVKKKIKAAEKSVANIVEMLTQLVAADAFPQDVAVQVENIIPPLYDMVKEEVDKLAVKKSFSTELNATQSDGTQSQLTETQATQAPATQSQAIQSQATQPKASQSQAIQSEAIRDLVSQPLVSPEPSVPPTTISKRSTDSTLLTDSVALRDPCVTWNDMKEYLKDLKNDVTNIFNRMMAKTTELTDTALHINKDVAFKLDIAQKLGIRISTFSAALEEYDNQFSGLQSVLSTQLQSIKTQITQMNHILKSGLAQLADLNNIAEAAVVMNLLELSEDMDVKLNTVLYEIKGLIITQLEHIAQMRNLKDSINMMHEEKADLAEVLESLKYKADSSALAGNQSYQEFAATHAGFERRIKHCHEIFQRRIKLWAELIQDLKNKKATKVDLNELLAARDSLEHQLQVLNNKIRILTAVLGDPQIALTARKLAVDATCGSCHEPAHMEPVDPNSGVPPRLPPLRQAPVVATKPCISDWIRPTPDPGHAMCHRWCGGSHTLVTDPTKRLQLHVQMQAIPTKHFTDYGDDGRLYMCEEPLQPCIECNSLGAEKTQDAVDLSNCVGAED